MCSAVKQHQHHHHSYHHNTTTSHQCSICSFLPSMPSPSKCSPTKDVQPCIPMQHDDQDHSLCPFSPPPGPSSSFSPALGLTENSSQGHAPPPPCAFSNIIKPRKGFTQPNLIIFLQTKQTLPLHVLVLNHIYFGLFSPNLFFLSLSLSTMKQK